MSRFNENLNWINTSPFDKYNFIVYNKGKNSDFDHSHISRTISYPNVGRESHTYLQHIIDNYDNLADINVFLHYCYIIDLLLLYFAYGIFYYY